MKILPKGQLESNPDKNINFTWVFFETVHGRSSVVSVLLGEVGRIISPFVFGQVKANLSLTTTDSRTMLALATVHLNSTLKNGSVHSKWFKSENIYYISDTSNQQLRLISVSCCLNSN